jgi:hypothetical protein
VTIEMHATGLKTGAKSVAASSVNGTRKGTMITMAPTMTCRNGNIPQSEDAMKGGQGFLSRLEDGVPAPECQAVSVIEPPQK